MAGCSTETPAQIPIQVPATKTTVPPQPAQTNTIQETDSNDQISSTATPDCLIAGGIVKDDSFSSDLLGKEFSYKIYLPPCYDELGGQNYPVLYLLHGLSYDNEQWIRLGVREQMDNLIQRGEINPFIMVLPNEDRFDPPELSLYGDVLVDELIPHIDSQYNTLKEKIYRRIGGLSRGAAWSVRIGFENYDLFSKVGAHSLPIFQSDVSHIQTWLTQIPTEELPLFFIDIGRNDPEWQSAQAFADQLDQYGVPHEWYLFNQGHSESYWSDHLEQYLLWYGKDW